MDLILIKRNTELKKDYLNQLLNGVVDDEEDKQTLKAENDVVHDSYISDEFHSTESGWRDGTSGSWKLNHEPVIMTPWL